MLHMRDMKNVRPFPRERVVGVVLVLMMLFNVAVISWRAV